MAKLKKIINDPIYGFISIESDLLHRLIEHPYFQRLRRIKQLGMTNLVYPGAEHTRFHHALGAMHLMEKAIETLRQKDIDISEQEKESAMVAILLHDIGHGPFSHTLEFSIVPGLTHEEISLLFFEELNREFEGKLDQAIEIFRGKHPKKFLHELVSSQLDVDRLDYLTRDSFYTGVSEGIIGLDRIIQMLYVKDNQLLIEEKGIYSIEKFMIARRLMYWQVYLHKTSLAADALLINLLKRARVLIAQGKLIFQPKALFPFLKDDIHPDQFENKGKFIEHFSLLDDHDIWVSIKNWAHSDDRILSELCTMLLNRKLLKTRISREPFQDIEESKLKEEILKNYDWLTSDEDAEYFFHAGEVNNAAYENLKNPIHIYRKDGSSVGLAEASDNYNMGIVGKKVVKYYLCTPK
jgi:HD superfamily phosphohydrolase